MRIVSFPVVLGLALLSLPGCMETNLISQPQPALPGDTTEPPAEAPVIRIDPASHDFGQPFLGCELTHTYSIHNDGNAPLVIDDLSFDAESGDLVFDSPHALPLTLGPTESADVSVSYLSFDKVADFGTLVALSNDPVTPEATASATGDAISAGEIQDVFEEPDQAKSDILVVVDNSGSMAEEQNNLTNNFQTFIDAVVAADADWRIAVITTDSPNFRGPVITAATGNPVGAFTSQASVGILGSGSEQPMQMIAEATMVGGDAEAGGLFLRDDAMLAIVIVTDEPDEFSTMTPAALTDHLVGIKGMNPDLVRVHTIGGDVPQPTCNSAAAASVPLDEIVSLTSGVFASVCDNWGNSLSAVADGSVILLSSFTLSQDPIPSSIEVRVAGDLVATGWTYDASDNTVSFQPNAMPEEGQTVKISYEPISECS